MTTYTMPASYDEIADHMDAGGRVEWLPSRGWPVPTCRSSQHFRDRSEISALANYRLVSADSEIPAGMFPGPDVDGRLTWLGQFRDVPGGWSWRLSDGNWTSGGSTYPGYWIQCRPPAPEPVTVTIPRDVAERYIAADAFARPIADRRAIDAAIVAALAQDGEA